MIKIEDKSLCCGCGACAAACPVSCIVMKEDAEGFAYPEVNTDTCIDCKLCEHVCPFLATEDRPRGKEGFLVINNNTDERKASSSGGAFSILARAVINNGGSVWGAAIDREYNIRHIEVSNMEGLAALRGSKYVESYLDNSYRLVKERLKTGMQVVFSGTPCQVAGLRRYLGKTYQGLLLIETACHGIASRRVWQQSLSELCQERGIARDEITSINFRDKSTGWEHYSFALTTRNSRYTTRQTAYLRGYGANLFLRPSCYRCHVKAAGSYADITLADAWGIEKESNDACYHDDRGVSFVLPHTEAGRTAVTTMTNCHIEAIDAEKMLEHNRCITQSVTEPKGRTRFFELFLSGTSVARSVAEAAPISPLKRIEQLLAPTLRALGIKGFTNRWRKKKE